MKAGMKHVILAGAIGMFLIALTVWCPPVFYLNDDVTIRSILSGKYIGTPDGHVVYMKYPLTGILSVFYRILNFVPWLELFFFGCFLWVVFEVVRNVKYKKSVLLLLALFVVPFFLYMHYTVIAALLAGTAVFLACTEKNGYKAVFLWLLAWSVRSQVAYLSIPFLGVGLLWRLLDVNWEGNITERKLRMRDEVKRILRAGGLGIAAFLICTGIHHICYAGEEWQTYLKYNDSRTELYDYTNFLSSGYSEEDFIGFGISEEEFRLLNTYNILLDHSIDEVKVAQITEAVRERMSEDRNEMVRLKECVKQYYYQIRYADSVYVILWIVLVAFLFIQLLILKSWYGILLLGCLEAGRSVIWLFLIWKGRFPERVELSLYIIEILLLLGMLQRPLMECNKKWNTLRRMRIQKRSQGRTVMAYADRICMSGVVLILVCFLGIQIKADRERTVEQYNIQKEWNILKDYCGRNPETLYLMDVFSAVEYSDLPYEKDAGNIMLAGGWMGASPLAEKRLTVHGAIDGAEALYKSEQVLFLAEGGCDVSWLEDYLQKRFGKCELLPQNEIVCSENKTFIEYRVCLE